MHVETNLLNFVRVGQLSEIAYLITLKFRLRLIFASSVAKIKGSKLQVEGKDQFGATYRHQFVPVLHEVMVHSTLLPR